MNRGVFAQKAHISPAVLSHIASGRNAPSLDLILAILRLFPDVDMQWLLLGKGDMYQTERMEAEIIHATKTPPNDGPVQPELFQAKPEVNSQQPPKIRQERTPDFQLLTRKIEELKFLVQLHTKNTADSISQLEAEIERMKGED